ncbi:MAG: hypothetical protein ABSH42_10535 [Bryobacteraceae bacterium]
MRAAVSASPSGAAAPFRLHTVRGRLVDVLDLSCTSALALQEDEAAFRRR